MPRMVLSSLLAVMVVVVVVAVAAVVVGLRSLRAFVRALWPH